MSDSDRQVTATDAPPDAASSWQRRRQLPIPPSIAIPPPPSAHLELSDVDMSLAARELGKLSPALGLGVFALSPLASRLPSPLSVNVVNHQQQQKPTAAEPGETSASDASPVSPTMLKDMAQFHPRYPITDSWAFESSPGNLYTMLLHSPQFTDFSYQQQVAATTAGSPTMAMSPQHMNHLLQLQGDPQQQIGAFGLQPSPIAGAARMMQHELQGHHLASGYPHLSPMSAAVASAATSMQHHSPQGQQTGGDDIMFAQKSETNYAMANFSEMMMLGADGGDAAPPQASPASVFRHTLPSMSPHFPSVDVKEITLNVLRPHFNKPMAVVAKELGVCITLMKKICRRNGLDRWPHRRIRSLVNRISSLQSLTASASEPELKRYQSQIDSLRLELSAVIENPNEKSRKAQSDAKSRSPSASSMMSAVFSFPNPTGAMMSMAIETSASIATSGSIQSDSAVRRSSKSRANAVSRAPTREVTTRSMRRGGDSGKAQPPARDDTAHQAAAAIADAKRNSAVVDAPIASRKRKSGLQNLRLHAPPPIKIPCRRDIRVRRNSAPEQQHLRTLLDSCSLIFAMERPSTTTNASRKRHSISAILCDPTE